MAAQRDVAKIGSEGFVLIDEYFGYLPLCSLPDSYVAPEASRTA
ncbi:hypothetical protein H5410_027264 [Solanum commersonii]|uniref:Uncharacterized protein n=1 Tax=Solanum commersonii TaxID=4109 RepID=A0A9J5Z2X5_SOLCO|nr:hypothetical protein H5410_027264 [Solanum commersonii]